MFARQPYFITLCSICVLIGFIIAVYNLLNLLNHNKIYKWQKYKTCMMPGKITFLDETAKKKKHHNLSLSGYLLNVVSGNKYLPRRGKEIRLIANCFLFEFNICV